jgi:CBS domain-containing membrane protein
VSTPSPRIAATLAGWLRAFWPEPIRVDWRERLRVVVVPRSASASPRCCATRSAQPPHPAWPWLVAPLGASAVLVFGVPSSPLAQPWAVVGGNTLSALVGVLCVRWVGAPELAAALAVGAAIALMFALRCLHPPGGASALLVARSGVSDPAFALYPVFANSVLLMLVGAAYNNATKRAYPHALRPALAEAAHDGDAEVLDAALGAVLARYNQVLDISATT